MNGECYALITKDNVSRPVNAQPACSASTHDEANTYAEIDDNTGQNRPAVREVNMIESDIYVGAEELSTPTPDQNLRAAAAPVAVDMIDSEIYEGVDA